MTRGIEDPRDHYYRRIYVDAHRAFSAMRDLLGIGCEPGRLVPAPLRRRSSIP